MTEVNFYTGVPDRQIYACRLLRKTQAAGLTVGVWGPMRLLERLDQTLWTFEPGEFLPHLLLRPDTPAQLRERTPILLCDQLDALAGCQVLLNFEPGVPPGLEQFFEQFEDSQLALLYDEKSNFNKLIGRDTAAARARGEHRAAR